MEKIMISNSSVDKDKLNFYMILMVFLLFLILTSIFQTDYIVESNMSFFLDEIDLVQDNILFIKLIAVIIQVIMALLSVLLDIVVLTILTYLVLRKKTLFRIYKTPVLFGNFIAVVITQLLIFLVNDFNFITLQKLSVIPLALLAKVIFIFCYLYKTNDTFDKKGSIIISTIYFVGSFLLSLINVFTI